MILLGQSLTEFDQISLQGNTTNKHLNNTTEDLLEYPPPLNALTNNNCGVGCSIHIYCNITVNCFTSKLTKINKLLPLFPRSDASKNLPPEELNETLPQVVPNGWAKKSYLQGWKFEMETFG